jgi:Asp-tRNA(Asn)/Glu-tRNA(Gln) amidotransferase C subunit
MGVDDLFEKIQDEQAATAAGWDVNYVRQRIRAAMPEPYRSGVQYDWEFFQRQLRSNDITFSARSEVVLMSHIFYKEFDGQISHAIIDERDSESFMYRKLRRFKRWEQIIHPMYYDRGDGEHHGVKGLGIKMLQAMELKNRLRCSMVDSAFARTQILFRPLNPNALSKTSVVQQGPYAILPPDYEVIQQNIAGVLDAPMAVNADLENVLQGNLSQYRQSLAKSGNPRTATEMEIISAQQSAIGKTQLSRYYNQLDSFFEERYNRASNPNLNPITKSDKDAIEFQRRCAERGVPVQAMLDIDFVEATRTVGQGSQFAKQKLLGSLLGLLGSLPEGGKVSLLRDYIAAQVGQQMVDRYLPTQIQSSRVQDQTALAVLEHSSLRQGNMAIVTDTQNQIVHIDTHLAAANEAAASIQQGGNPQEIMLFLQGIGQHVQDHLARLSTDPTRRPQVEAYAQQLQMVVQTVQQLGELLQQQQEAQAQMQQAQAIQQGVDPKTAMMNAEVQAKIARQNAEVMANIQRQNEKAMADLARRNAKTTADIQRANATAESNLARQG